MCIVVPYIPERHSRKYMHFQTRRERDFILVLLNLYNVITRPKGLQSAMLTPGAALVQLGRWAQGARGVHGLSKSSEGAMLSPKTHHHPFETSLKALGLPERDIKSPYSVASGL
jgi:hypothetical protein